MVVSDRSGEARARAEANFLKVQVRAEQGAKAEVERVAATREMEDKTARLRALRLAKEAEPTKKKG